jgi:hypothetical protein
VFLAICPYSFLHSSATFSGDTFSFFVATVCNFPILWKGEGGRGRAVKELSSDKKSEYARQNNAFSSYGFMQRLRKVNRVNLEEFIQEQ